MIKLRAQSAFDMALEKESDRTWEMMRAIRLSGRGRIEDELSTLFSETLALIMFSI